MNLPFPVQSKGMGAFFQIFRLGSMRCGFSWSDTLSLYESVSHVRDIVRERDVFEIRGDRGVVFCEVVFPIGAKKLPFLREVSSEACPTFIFSTNQTANRTIRNDLAWALLFSSGTLFVFERKKDPLRILRYGLSSTEAATFGKKLFAELERLAQKNTIPPLPGFAEDPDILLQPASAGIALWVDGELRGSAVAHEQHFNASAHAALVNAYFDRRFVPLAAEEIKTADIELTIFPAKGLRVFDMRTLDPELAYQYKDPVRGLFGWYLPEVFNVRDFASVSDFFSSLRKEKANAQTHRGWFEAYTTQGWMLRAGGRAIPLRGPGRSRAAASLTERAMTSLIEEMIQWLARTQMPNGAFPQSLSPRTGKRKGYDLDRMAHALWAIAEANQSLSSDTLSSVRERLEAFLVARKGECFSRPFCAVFLSRYFLLQGDREAAQEAALSALRPHAALREARLLLDTYLVYLFEAIPELAKLAEHPAVRILRNIADEPFMRGINPAWYGEAALSLSRIDSFAAQKVLDFVVSSQCADGAFPDDEPRLLPYTRGTGKLFEVLAGFPDCWKQAAEPALSWLLSMQITEETDYWIRPEFRAAVHGGFRHDALDSGEWVDAVSHTLVGCTRRLQSMKKNE